MKPGEWTTNLKQAIFLQREEDEVLYGGARAGGKSLGLLFFSIGRRVKYPGTSGFFLRRTFAQLSKEGGAIEESMKLLSGVAAWQGDARKWRFPNGSTLEFGHCEHEADKEDYRSAQVHDACFDELTQFTESQYMFIKGSVRSAMPGVKPLVRAGTNPLGVGHRWVYKRFVEPAPPYTSFQQVDVVRGVSHVTTRCFIPATIFDNTHLMAADPDYPARLAQLPEMERRAMLYGRWDIFEGQAFIEFGDQHVCQPQELPVEWPRWCAIDYGYKDPMAVLWFARDLDYEKETGWPRYYCYREVYKTGLEPKRQAIYIRQLSGDERVRAYLPDPTIWISRGKGISIAADYGEMGLHPLFKPNNDRIQGKARVHWLLGDNPDGLPRLQIFSSCRNLVRTLPMLRYDDHAPEDVDTDDEDHAYDALRYFATFMANPIRRHIPVAYRIGA